MPNDRTPSLTGQTLDGRYEVKRLLGSGGMGEVYLALDQRTGGPVVLKSPWPGMLIDDPSLRKRFIREIRTMSRLDHPNIIKVYDVVEHEGLPVAVMQYLSGGDLEAQSKVPLEKWLPQIASALDYLHLNKLVHRDVKPANIFFDSHRNPYLGDFGIVKPLAGAGTMFETLHGGTQTAFALGTPKYMSPEAVEGRELDGRSDQYALAIIVYERLASRMPFDAETPAHIFAAHLTAKPHPLSESDRRYGDGISDVLNRALAKRAQERFGACREFADAVLTALDVPPAKGPPSDSSPQPDQIQPVRASVVRVETTPGGAGVIIDGQLRGHAPLELPLQAGEYRLRVELDGYLPVERRVSFDAQRDVCFDIALRRQSEIREMARTTFDTLPEIANSIGMRLRLIPPGEFLMGSRQSEQERWNDEGPPHRVRITKPFYLGIYPVTQEQYRHVMDRNPSRFQGSAGFFGLFARRDEPTRPVECVSWHDAMEFCRRMSEREARQYRLPTEAEWEYACRAGTATPFHFGSILNGRQANCDGNYPYGTKTRGPYLGRPTAVGSYGANGFGLYDMHGNVWEWCADWYEAEYYRNSPVDDPPGPLSGSFCVGRGGSWDAFAGYCRAASRATDTPDYRGHNLGFRLALVPGDQSSK